MQLFLFCFSRIRMIFGGEEASGGGGKSRAPPGGKTDLTRKLFSFLPVQLKLALVRLLHHRVCQIKHRLCSHPTGCLHLLLEVDYLLSQSYIHIYPPYIICLIQHDDDTWSHSQF